MSETTTSKTISGTSLADIEKAQPAVDQFLDKHQMKLIAFVLLLIAVAVVYLVQREIKQSKEQTAGALLVSKNETADLEGIIKNYGDTAAAGSSSILLAEKQWDEGKPDDAIATLRGIADTKEPHPARANAVASLATKLLKQGKTSDAEKLFTELTEDESASHLAAYAWISLGDIAVGKGDLVSAEKAYTTVEKDFAESTQAQAAVSRRLLTKAANPVEIAAPIVLPGSKIIDGKGGAGGELEIKNIEDALKAISQGVPQSKQIPLPEGNGADK
jgi:predicted negative regulator of RcsB-dependent stress response